MWKKKRARKKEKIESKERDRQVKRETDRHTERKEGSTKCLTGQRWIVTIIMGEPWSTSHVFAATKGPEHSTCRCTIRRLGSIP